MRRFTIICADNEDLKEVLAAAAHTTTTGVKIRLDRILAPIGRDFIPTAVYPATQVPGSGAYGPATAVRFEFPRRSSTHVPLRILAHAAACDRVLVQNEDGTFTRPHKLLHTAVEEAQRGGII